MASAADQLKGVAELLTVGNTLFGGGGTKTTQTSSGYRQTSGQDISPEGLQRIIDTMMAGPGGVKDISGAARGAGLYNSTTEAQLLNDLATRVAGEAAARSAKTVTDVGPSTMTQITVPQGGMSPMSGLLGIGGMKLAGGLLDKVLGDEESGGILSGIGEALGFGGSNTGVQQVGSLASGGNLGLKLTSNTGLTGTGDPFISAGSALGNSLGSMLGGSGLSLGGGGLGFSGTGGLGLSLGDLGGSTAASIGGGTLGLGSDFASVSSMLNDPSSLFTTALGGAGDIGAVGASTLGDALSGLGAVPLSAFTSPVMSLLGGILGGKDYLHPLSLGMSSISGGLALAPALGPLAPLGFLAGPLAGGLGSLFGGSVICTALKKRGLLDPIEYALGEEYLRRLSSYTITGYYVWGLPVARAIDDGSPWAIALTLPWAHSRMKLLADRKHKWTKYLRYPLGTITWLIGQPACWALGALISITLGVNYGRIR